MGIQNEASIDQRGGDLSLISIITTSYNAASTLKASLLAALTQADSNFEVVLVDDGSTDETRQICEAIFDSRFRYIPMPRLGRSKALNIAIAAAKGTLIAINDADDLSHPNRLTVCRAAFRRNPDAVIVGTNFWVTPSLPQQDAFRWLADELNRGDEDREISAEEMFRGNPLLHSSVMFSKKLWQVINGYDEDLSICVDYDFYLRALPWGKIVCLPRKTVLQYQNEESFFRKKSVPEYLSTLLYIQRRARKAVSLPLWTRVYELVPFCLYAKFLIHRIGKGLYRTRTVSRNG